MKHSYKRPFDITLLVTSHIVLFPVWLLIWGLIPLMVWLGDRGPIFFRQERLGKNGEVIAILKFRTMVQNAEQLGPAWNVDGDPRVTWVGHILRRTALDEVPSLLNILKGDMSFVGPRALDTQEHKLLEREIPGFVCRLQVVPGLTGLAQVYDKFDIAEDKLRYDLEYIERMSLRLDVYLILVSIKNTILARWDQRKGKSDFPSDIQH